jgi:hypothetical protein
MKTAGKFKMNKHAGLSNFREFFLFFLILILSLLFLVSADVLSVNPTGSTEHAQTPEKHIEGFFSALGIIPIISNVVLNSTSGNNLTSDNLTCWGILSDTDAGTLFNVTILWYKNGGLNSTINYNNNYPNATNFNAVLLSGNTTKGEKWMCSLRSYDGFYYSSWYNSTNLTIENTPPNISLYSPENGNITINRTPSFYWNGSDADGDSLTYELNLTVGGTCTCSDDRPDINAGANQNYTIQEYLLCLKDNGCYYNWTAKAYDGINYSSWATPRKIEIQASLAIVLINDTVNFGDIQMGATNNTVTNNPYPFSLQNDGNCFTNVSLNATALWVTNITDSNNYQFKIDNLSGEEGAFNSLESQTNWDTVPIVPNERNGISKLNFSDSKDSAEVDILVIVPNQEPAGTRGSFVYFPARLGE